MRDCVAIAKSAIKVVMPVKTGIQKMLNILDSPVSSTGQAHRRAPLARNDKKVITTQSHAPGRSDIIFPVRTGFSPTRTMADGAVNT
jgi:hypothetical protein